MVLVIRLGNNSILLQAKNKAEKKDWGQELAWEQKWKWEITVDKNQQIQL